MTFSMQNGDKYGLSSLRATEIQEGYGSKMGAKTTKMTHEKIAVARDKMVTKQKKLESQKTTQKYPRKHSQLPKQLYYSYTIL